jgi:Flp pilus assembly protein TadG
MGAAAVEFALLLPIILLVIFAIIDFGRMLNAQITLTEAAREGARAAALIDKPAGEARAKLAGESTLGPIAPAVVDCSDPATVSASADIAHAFEFVTPLGIFISDGAITLNGHGVMPCLH